MSSMPRPASPCRLPDLPAPRGGVLRRLPTLVVAGITLAHAPPALADPGILWYGGLDPETGLAVPGGVWDFEGCDLQGWTSVDLTHEGLRAAHVTADSVAAHGDPVSPVITEGSSTGSLWIGMHEDEARARLWPGGQGYGNAWIQQLAKSFVYAGAGSVEVAFDYFVDAEWSDMTRVFVVNDDGSRSPHLGEGDSSYGYYGSVQDGESVGTPSSPAREHIVVPPQYLPATAGASFELVFEFESDHFYSDELHHDWVHDTVWGPFGLDDVEVSGTGLHDVSDFEPGAAPGDELDGWELRTPPPIGAFIQVAPIDSLPTTEEMPPECAVDGCALLAADLNGPDPHPYRQREVLRSNAVAVPDSVTFGTLDHALDPGPHAMSWDGEDSHGNRVASGTYFIRASIPGSGAETTKVVIP